MTTIATAIHEAAAGLAFPADDPAAAGRAIHERIERELRAKPLNARTLDALPVGLVVWDDQITYLREALRDNAERGYPLPPKLRASFSEQLAQLERAREWLASKVAAERVGREG